MDFCESVPDCRNEKNRLYTASELVFITLVSVMCGSDTWDDVELFCRSQFDYFKKVAPWAKLMFVGPADMSKSVNGSLVTWPLLPELNDSLKVHCLNNGIAYWDTFNMMGGVGSMREWVNHNPQLAGPDYIHFTTRGAAEVGSALAKSLLLYDDFRRLRLTLSDQAVREYLDSLTDKTPVAQIDSSLRSE